MASDILQTHVYELADANALEKWKSDLWDRAKKNDFWHAANVAFSKKDRDAFNAWKDELWIQAERTRDAARSLGESKRSLYASQEASKLYEMVCTIPLLEK